MALFVCFCIFSNMIKEERKITNNHKEKALEKGQVITVYKDRYIVEFNDKKIQMQVSGRFSYIHYQKADFPQVGDYVYFHQESEDFGIIESIQDRKSTLSRLDVGTIGEKHILAVNIDIVFICMSLNNDYNTKKLRNYLSLASSDEYEVIILLTKKDLTDKIDFYINETKKVTDNEILSITAFSQEDIETIRNKLENKTAVFIGSSGVGKSTIINTLMGEEHFKVQGIRMADSQGRHTTVHRELIRLPNGGNVIDTPGIRIVSSYFVDESNFEDILSLSEGCMFSDCTHTVEPGCMIHKSIEDGTLDIERYDQYKKAMRLNAYNLSRARKRERILNKKARKG